MDCALAVPGLLKTLNGSPGWDQTFRLLLVDGLGMRLWLVAMEIAQMVPDEA